MSERRSGRVKWFDAKKGFGFITPDDGRVDVFLHYTDLDGKGFRSVNEGDYVEFDTVTDAKGLRAQRVKVLTSSAREPELKHRHD